MLLGYDLMILYSGSTGNENLPKTVGMVWTNYLRFLLNYFLCYCIVLTPYTLVLHANKDNDLYYVLRSFSIP